MNYFRDKSTTKCSPWNVIRAAYELFTIRLAGLLDRLTINRSVEVLGACMPRGRLAIAA